MQTVNEVPIGKKEAAVIHQDRENHLEAPRLVSDVQYNAREARHTMTSTATMFRAEGLPLPGLISLNMPGRCQNDPLVRFS